MADNAIELPQLNIQTMCLKVIGDSPLVCHRFSEKAKKQILDKQMKKAKGAKEAKDPQADYEASLYPHPDGGYGFPAIGLKAAAVSACRNVDGITMTMARQAFHIPCELVVIDGEPEMREDMVRLNGKTADIRYRGAFNEWSTEFDVRFDANVISVEQLVNLFNIAGFAVGIGEHRPERSGSWGMFHIATEDS